MKRYSTLQTNVFRRAGRPKMAYAKLFKGRSVKLFRSNQSNTCVLPKQTTFKPVPSAKKLKQAPSILTSNFLGYQYRDLWKQKRVFSIEKDMYRNPATMKTEKENQLRQIRRAKKSRKNFLIKIGALKGRKGK